MYRNTIEERPTQALTCPSRVSHARCALRSTARTKNDVRCLLRLLSRLLVLLISFLSVILYVRASLGRRAYLPHGGAHDATVTYVCGMDTTIHQHFVQRTKRRRDNDVSSRFCSQSRENGRKVYKSHPLSVTDCYCIRHYQRAPPSCPPACPQQSSLTV